MKKVFLISITVIFCISALFAESYWEDYSNSYDASMSFPSFGENQITSNGDSLNCRLLGRPLFGACKSATGNGTYAFGGFGYSLISFDATDPSNPKIADYVELGFSPTDLVFHDSLLYVGLWYFGVQIYDVSDPYNMQFVGEYYNSKYVNDINIFDSLLVIAEDGYEVTVLDISNPSMPSRVTAFSTTNAVQEAWIKDDTLVFTAEVASGMRVYNIKDTLSIYQVGFYDTPGSSRGVTVKDTVAYVSDFTNGVVVLGISDPANPQLLSTYNDPGAAYTVAIEDTVALLTDDSGGLRVLSCANPDSLYELGFYDDDSYIRFVSHAGNFIYAQDYFKGMLIFDVSDITNPLLLSTHYEGGTIAKVDAVDTILYAAMGDEGFAIINVSDPSDAFFIGKFDSTGTTSDIKVKGQYAYVANSSFGLQIINITDPLNPFTVSTLNTGNVARTIEIIDSFVYIGNDTGGLKIINVSNPAIPLQVGTCNTPGKANGLFIRDTLVFVADYDYGMRIIDVSDKSSPVEIGSYDSPGYSYNIAVYDTFAILADHWRGFRILSIADPANPVLLDSFETNGYAYDVVIEWPLLYLSDDTCGLRIFNILNPADPKEIGYYDTYGGATGLDFQDSTVYCAETFAGITLLNYTKPLTFTLSGTVGLDQNPADSSGTLVRGIEFAQSCSTDASGNYQFADMLEGTYTLIFEHAGYHPDTMTAVFTGYETFNTTLDYIELYMMLGKIGLLDNPADSSESYLWIDELSVGDSTNSAGDFYFAAIPAGDYTLIASHDGYWPDTFTAVFTGTENFSTDLSVCDTTPPAPFSLIEPSGNTFTNFPTYRWTHSTDLHFMNYQLFVDDLLQETMTDTFTDQPTPLTDGLHTWYVMANDSFSNSTHSTETETIYIDMTPPDAPALSTPANNGYSSNNEIAWHPAADNFSGTFCYDALIDDDSLFGSIDEVVGNWEDTLFQFNLSEGQYFWNVLGYDSFYNMGPSSQTWSFKYDTTGPSAPVLSTPSDKSYTSDNSIAWHPATDNLSGISHYIVEIDNDSLFGSVNATEDLEETLYVFTLPDGIYFWRVMAYDSSDNSGAWSSAWSFEYDPTEPSAPVLSHPIDFAKLTNTSVWFDWTAVVRVMNETKTNEDNIKASPVSYALQIDTTLLFASPLHDDTFTIDTTRYSLAEGIKYFWRVMAFDAVNNQSSWSGIDSFAIDQLYPSTPVLVSPSDSAIANTSIFIWNASSDNYSGVQYYDLVYDDDSLFASPETITTADTSYSASLTDGRYFWRVRAIDNFDNTGSWASKQMFDFDATPPSAPILLSPADSCVTSSSIFVWNTSSDNFTGVKEYLLWYDDDSLFGSPNTATTAETTYTAVLSDYNYFWRVRAFDNADNTGSWSDIWSFDFSPAGISEKFIIDTKEKRETSLTVSMNEIQFTTISLKSKFSIYDITGKIVYSCSENRIGRHVYATDDLASGIYFVRLKDKEKEINKKIVIVR